MLTDPAYNQRSPIAVEKHLHLHAMKEAEVIPKAPASIMVPPTAHTPAPSHASHVGAAAARNVFGCSVGCGACSDREPGEQTPPGGGGWRRG